MSKAMLIRCLPLAALVLAGGCSRDRTAVAVDAALLTQVPADTVALGAMRVKALRGTAAWKRLLEQPGVNAEMDRLASLTSFDPRKDLWEVLWSTNGKDSLVYARGEFAPLGLEPKIEREGVQRMNYKGSMLLGTEETAVWFVNSSTGIFGRTPKIRELIDARDVSKPGPAQGLRDRIGAIPPGAHFWMVADAAALPEIPVPAASAGGGMGMNFLQNLPKLMRTVKMLTMHASLVDGMAMEWTAYCDSETGARQVHDSLRGMVGLGRIVLPEKDRPVLMPLLDAVEVAQNKTETTLRARLTVEQFENVQGLVLAKPAKGKTGD
jgi:hypothetical protein